MQPNNISFYTKNYLPSKKIQYIIIVLIVGVVAYLVIPKITDYYQTHRVSLSITGKPPEPLIATTPTPTSFDRDTDGDGIPDWQEQLFGLDPNKKDSNNDGVSDGLPTVKGQSVGDLITLPNVDKLALAVYTKFQDTPTDAITTDQFKAATSDQILAQAQSVEDGLKKYKTIDLELGDSDKTAILAYQSAITSLINSVPDGAIFAKNIQEKILKNTNSAKFEIDFLNQTIIKLLAMPVPARMSDLHLKFLNSAYYILQILQMPPSDDELNTYTLSLVAQKNINVISETAGDINTIADVYKTYD